MSDFTLDDAFAYVDSITTQVHLEIRDPEALAACLRIARASKLQ